MTHLQRAAIGLIALLAIALSGCGLLRDVFGTGGQTPSTSINVSCADSGGATSQAEDEAGEEDDD